MSGIVPGTTPTTAGQRRARNWDCEFCPLTFDRLSAAEEHVRTEHQRAAGTAPGTPGRAPMSPAFACWYRIGLPLAADDVLAAAWTYQHDAERAFWVQVDTAIAAAPQPAPGYGELRRRLGNALAALREIAEFTADDARTEARNALDDDAAIRKESPEQPAPASRSQVRRHAEQRDTPELLREGRWRIVVNATGEPASEEVFDTEDAATGLCAELNAKAGREWFGARPVPQAAPGLREALAELVADWREGSKYRVTDTRDEINEGLAVSACADSLAAILDEHPEPQPAPELAAARPLDADFMAEVMAERDRLRVLALELIGVLESRSMFIRSQ